MHWELDWKDVSDLPASTFMGRCVMLKITDIEPAAKITAAHMDKADGGRTRKGALALQRVGLLSGACSSHRGNRWIQRMN